MLANLDVDKGSEVLQMMPPNIQEQVIEVGGVETTPLAQVQWLLIPLEVELRKVSSSVLWSKVAADLLNWFDREQSRNFLKVLKKKP